MRTMHLNHSTYKLQYHIVWGTKYRYRWLKDYVLTELRKSFAQTLKKYPTLHLLESNADLDHVHVQIEIPPNIAIADAVGRLKSYSSTHLRKAFKFIREIYLEKDGVWSVGYFVSSIGLNEEAIKKYSEWQSRRERPQKTHLF